MAKQRNQYYIGRQGNLVYYMWQGGYYIRTRSTLSGKRFWEDKAFAGSRKRAVEFGAAAKLASEVYQLLPLKERRRGVIGKLTGEAHTALMAGKTKEVVKRELLIAYGVLPAAEMLGYQEAIVSLDLVGMFGKRDSVTEAGNMATLAISAQGVLHNWDEKKPKLPDG